MPTRKSTARDVEQQAKPQPSPAEAHPGEEPCKQCGARVPKALIGKQVTKLCPSCLHEVRAESARRRQVRERAEFDTHARDNARPPATLVTEAPCMKCGGSGPKAFRRGKPIRVCKKCISAMGREYGHRSQVARARATAPEPTDITEVQVDGSPSDPSPPEPADGHDEFPNHEREESPMTDKPLHPAEQCCPGQIHHTDDCEARKALAARFGGEQAAAAVEPSPPARVLETGTPLGYPSAPPAPADPIEAAVALLGSVPFGRIVELQPEQEKAIRELLKAWA